MYYCYSQIFVVKFLFGRADRKFNHYWLSPNEGLISINCASVCACVALTVINLLLQRLPGVARVATYITQSNTFRTSQFWQAYFRWHLNYCRACLLLCLSVCLSLAFLLATCLICGQFKAAHRRVRNSRFSFTLRCAFDITVCALLLLFFLYYTVAQLVQWTDDQFVYCQRIYYSINDHWALLLCVYFTPLWSEKALEINGLFRIRLNCFVNMDRCGTTANSANISAIWPVISKEYMNLIFITVYFGNLI